VSVVVAALKCGGGGVRVDELADKTGRSAFDMLDALHQLQRQGLAQPRAWTIVDLAHDDEAGARQRRSSRGTRSLGLGWGRVKAGKRGAPS
jgi:hypothetical protein